MAPFSNVDIRLIPTVQYSAPTTGATVNVNTNGNVSLHINPAGTLVALTVALPSGPSQGDKLTISSSQAITGLTMNNGTVIGALTTMAIGAFATYEYDSTTSSWFRIG